MKHKLFLIPLFFLVGCSTVTSVSSKESSIQSSTNSIASIDKDSSKENFSSNHTSSLDSNSSIYSSSSLESNTSYDTSISTSSDSSSYEDRVIDMEKLLNTLKSQQLEKEVSYVMTSVQVEDKLSYDEYVTKKETILNVNEYENGLIRSEINKTYHDDTVAYSYTGEGKVTFHNNQYIDYMQYNVNRDEIVSSKEDYIKTINPINLKSYLICDVTTDIKDNLELLNEKFTLETIDGKTTYSLNCLKIKAQDKKEEYKISFIVNSNKQLISYSFEQKTYSYDWIKEDFKNTYKLIKKTYEITYGTITSVDISAEDVCLSDVSLSLYDINDSSRTALDLNNVRISTSIDVLVTDYSPSTAMDTHFCIASSSNENIIAKTSYGIYKVIGVGTVILTIKNELGFTKLVNVSTFAPALESIDFQVSSNNLYVGNEYLLSLVLKPTDAVSDVEFISSNVDIIEVIKKEDKYYLSCKALGTAEITVKSTTNPSISMTKSFEVKETTLKQFLLDNIFRGYDFYTLADIRIEFINSFQGKIFFNKTERQFTYSINSNVIKFSQFDYCGATYVTNTITISEDLSSASLSCIDQFYYSMIEADLKIVSK